MQQQEGAGGRGQQVGGIECVQCSEEVKQANQRSDAMGISTDVSNNRS